MVYKNQSCLKCVGGAKRKNIFWKFCRSQEPDGQRFVNSLCDKMCIDLKMTMIIYHGMFPYNDEENAWITKT